MVFSMDWLNYHHLLYFWVVAREGSIARACEVLKRAQPTISGELRDLESALGQKLFHRAGRGLILTEAGQLVFSYADKIFKLGQELSNALAGHDAKRPRRLLVGLSLGLSALLVERLLEPIHQVDPTVQLVCREDRPGRLLADLVASGLDVVLSDAPVNPLVKVRAVSHLLGQCGLSFFASPELAQQVVADFPRSLHQAPLLLPGEDSSIRQTLESWLRRQQLRPQVRGEIETSTLLKLFGQKSLGIFVLPSIIEEAVCKRYQVQMIGRPQGLCVRCYAFTAQRRISHPGVRTLVETARRNLFSQDNPSGISH